MRGYRTRDMAVERELAAFLDEHLYNDGRFSEHRRTDELGNQLSGSDIVLTIPSIGLESAITDEKGMTQYIPSLPTFALELSFLVRGQVIEGWLTDENKATDYYMFLWIQDTGGKKWQLTKDDFKSVDYALVKRQSILDYLDSAGYSIKGLRDKAKEIRENGITGQIDKGINPYFWFYFTDIAKLPEAPINIVLKRTLYERLAILKGNIIV